MRNQPKNEVNKVELIDFKDPKKFANVAYLLDREDFLKDMLQLRGTIQKQTGVQLPLEWKPQIQWDSQLWKPLSPEELNELDKRFRESAKSYLIATVDDAVTEEIKTALKQAIRMNPSEGFWLDVKELREKYHQSLLMEKVIAKAVIYNEIHEDDYLGCYVEILSPTLDFFFNYNESVIVIVVDPSTKVDDLERAYHEQLKEKQKEYRDTGMAPEYPMTVKKGKSTIIRDREFYWLSNGQGSWIKTANWVGNHRLETIKPNYEGTHIPDTCIWCNTISEPNDILKAVNSYNKWLSQK